MGMENNGWQIWSWNDKVCGNISKDADGPSTSYVNILGAGKIFKKESILSEGLKRSLKHDNFKKAGLLTLVLPCGTTWNTYPWLSFVFAALSESFAEYNTNPN